VGELVLALNVREANAGDQLVWNVDYRPHAHIDLLAILERLEVVTLHLLAVSTEVQTRHVVILRQLPASHGLSLSQDLSDVLNVACWLTCLLEGILEEVVDVEVVLGVLLDVDRQESWASIVALRNHLLLLLGDLWLLHNSLLLL